MDAKLRSSERRENGIPLGRLDGRVAIVTGGGEGIGRAISNIFASEGARTVVVDIDPATAQDAAQSINEAGGRAEAVEADIANQDDMSRLFAAVADQFGQLDILVNNAGINVRGDMRHVEDEQIERMLETNVAAVMRCVRSSFSLLKDSEKASIINISSIMAVRHMPHSGLYSTTKGALSAYTRSIAVDFARFGIRANAICPGYVETAMTAQILRVPKLREALEDRTPMRRLGHPHEIASVALFLASDEASYITGACIPVDGGMSIGL